MDKFLKKTVLILSLVSLVLFSACSTENNTSENNNLNENRDALSRENSSNSIEENQAQSASLTIEDGTYNQSVQYDTPGGITEAVINFEIKDNIIQSIEVTKPEDTFEISAKRIDSFNNNKNKLIGKSIDEIKEMGIIGGSSLTTEAVMNKFEEMSNI